MTTKTEPSRENLTLRELNRASLARQMLLQREVVGPVEAIERLGGLQAQYSPSPYIALWTRVEGFDKESLTAALLDHSVVKATMMRWTLHLSSGRDFPYYTTAIGDALTATIKAEAERAGVDIPALHRTLLDYLQTPKLLGDAVDYMNEKVGEGVRRTKFLAFRWAHAPGWVVHAPPSGTWRYFGTNSYVSAHEWLGPVEQPTLEEATIHLVRRYLAAYGPATTKDAAQWSGLRSLKQIEATIQAMGDEIVTFQDEDGKNMYDLRSSPRPGADVASPVRYLPKWDNLLLAYSKRDRVLPERYRKTVIAINGDVAPTFLIDGVVAGMWTNTFKSKKATLSLRSFEEIAPSVRAALEEEGERLIKWIEPEAASYEIVIDRV